MIYLIGGPARCGKSTLAIRVRRIIDGSVLSGDAAVYSLKNYLKEEWVPGIFTGTVNPVQKLAEPSAQLERLLERDAAVWPFYEKYIEALQRDVPLEDILIDGNLWPELVGNLAQKHRAVFMINLAPPEQQARVLISIRDSDADNNWMQKWSDERIGAWAHLICSVVSVMLRCVTDTDIHTSMFPRVSQKRRIKHLNTSLEKRYNKDTSLIPRGGVV